MMKWRFQEFPQKHNKYARLSFLHTSLVNVAPLSGSYASSGPIFNFKQFNKLISLYTSCQSSSGFDLWRIEWHIRDQLLNLYYKFIASLFMIIYVSMRVQRIWPLITADKRTQLQRMAKWHFFISLK